MAVSTDDEGNFKSMERFLPSDNFSALDMNFGPDGDLYILDYGKGWFTANEDAKLIRIRYNAGNRKPMVKIGTDAAAGALPFKVSLTSAGTKDDDRNDPLTYQWVIKSSAGELMQQSTQENPVFTLDRQGRYMAVLTVKDSNGAASADSIELIAGNEPPEVNINISKGNQTFFFPGEPFDYEIAIKDKEDGSVKKEKATFTIDVVSGAFGVHPGEPDPKNKKQIGSRISIFGGMLLNSSDCYSCHAINKKSIGPTFKQIADRYKAEPEAVGMLAKKIINGGSGNWGSAAMSAHPDLEEEKARQMVMFIQSLSAPVSGTLPLKGKYVPPVIKEGEEKNSVLMLRAKYTDEGANDVPEQTTEESIALRVPSLQVGSPEMEKGYMKVKVPNSSREIILLTGDQSYVGFRQLDFTGIHAIEMVLSPSASSSLEIRLDSVSGAIAGSYPALKPDTANSRKPQKINIPVRNATGKHDVFFVFHNAQAKKGSILLALESITFRLK